MIPINFKVNSSSNSGLACKIVFMCFKVVLLIYSGSTLKQICLRRPNDLLLHEWQKNKLRLADINNKYDVQEFQGQQLDAEIRI